MVISPVAYIIFNRPQHTEQTFAALRENRPAQLFIIADGPRPGHPTDAERCAQVREIVEQVDWPCEVHRHYADLNMGLKQRVSSGLDWVFENVDCAIVLEDDCLAHPDFFRFCDELIERYKSDERVAVITGNNFQNGQGRGEASYYFSKYNHCWGWATWRRAWQHYQGDLPFWPEWSRSDNWRMKMQDGVERRYWSKIFKRVRAAKIDSWAYPWTACVWFRGCLTATPNVNLVSNIGFGPDSTHTAFSDSPFANMKTSPMDEIIHPAIIAQDTAADRYVFDYHFGGKSRRFPYSIVNLPRRLIGLINRRLKMSIT